MDELQTLQQQRPRQVEACSIERQLAPGAPAYILKNTTVRRHMKLSEEGLFLWQLIDGQRTIRDLCTLYIERFQRPAVDEVLRALARLLGWIRRVRGYASRRSGAVAQAGELAAPIAVAVHSILQPARH
jgi:hypothetical protein